MQKIPILVFLVFTLKVYASHIVGGEFELVHSHSYFYHVNMILYFDDVNGNPLAEDTLVEASIYRKKDNFLMAKTVLKNQGSTFVPYTNIKCTVDQLRTRRIFYTNDIYLDPEKYTDEEGYYLVWERCCRNMIITNITRPDQTGQVFYLEFPPVTKNGGAFVDSTPILFPPLSDYACTNELYYVDFSGTDPDQDSLVYSVVQPLAGTTSVGNAVANPSNPAPYPVVNWVDDVSTLNCIPGNPSLQISHDGLITLKPSQTGLFVFSILCEEFRYGVRIGLVRRDFQLLVLDCPDPGHPPELKVKAPGTTFYTSRPDTLHFRNNDNKCLSFIVRDGDAGGKHIKIQAKSVNFHADLNDLLSITQGYLNSSADSLNLDMCFPDCPYMRDKPYIIDLIASDDACPLPLLDTVRLIVVVEPPPNNPPYFTNPASSIIENINEGENVLIPLIGKDDDNDSLFYNVTLLGFDSSQYEMKFVNLVDTPGIISFNFQWSTDCTKNNFDKFQKFPMLVTLEDKDFCNLKDPDSMNLLINVILPGNTKPVISTDLPGESASVRILDKINFHVTASDADGDSITLYTRGLNFNPSDFGFSTLDTSGIGIINVPFLWNLKCEYFKNKPDSSFNIMFISEDKDRCKISNSDTLIIPFNALLPENSPPTLSYENYPDGSALLYPGDQINLEISSIDTDLDSIHLILSNLNDLEKKFNIHFEPVNGKGSISATFIWKSDCSFLADNFQQQLITLEFMATDNRCIVSTTDSSDFTLLLKDNEADFNGVFIPNVFTPNSDSLNEYFTVTGLPDDNCQFKFEYVSIFNRYGKEVFRSNDKLFKWSGQNADPGVYYYFLKYNLREYKGFVHILN